MATAVATIGAHDAKPSAQELTSMANRLLALAVAARGKRLGQELIAAVDRLERAAEITALDESGHRVESSEPAR